jgi:protein phosphatase inhibitor 2
MEDTSSTLAPPPGTAAEAERPGSGTHTPSRGGTVKPALKKDPAHHTGDGAATGSTDYEKKHLKWDEKAIEEHDQLRGTRMKIDEPNTPYTHYDSGAESDGSGRPKSPAHQRPTLSWDVLQTKLDSVAAVREVYPSSPSSHAETDHSDVEEDRKREMRDMEFKEHRKRHYNEMDAVRKFRQDHDDGDDTNVMADQSGDADDEDEDE